MTFETELSVCHRLKLLKTLISFLISIDCKQVCQADPSRQDVFVVALSVLP